MATYRIARGVYQITEPIELNNPTVLLGAGRGAILLKCQGENSLTEDIQAGFVIPRKFPII